jgi:predicted DNA-binding transcriptional regulator AlpA
VLLLVPVSKSTLWRRVQDQTFPQPVRLVGRITVWRVEDVHRWIAQQGGQP